MDSSTHLAVVVVGMVHWQKIVSFNDLCTLVVFSCGGFGIGDGVYGYSDGVVNTIVVVGGCMGGLVGW